MTQTTESFSVSVANVRKAYGTTTALDDVSLTVQAGEFLTLLGPSGCGKTTLLNLIAGFVQPDQGSICIDGESVNELPPYRRSIGMVFQHYALFPHMSVADNVGFGLKMRQVPKSEIAVRVKAALEMVRLGQLGERRPRELSGGQQQRIALARALVINPKVVLLDEPFSAIDKNLRAEMQVELKQIQQRLGITTIFVTHDQSEALSLSDRIAVMSHGQIEQLSAPADLYRHPASSFVASFIGDINRLPCVIKARTETTCTVAMADTPLTLPITHPALSIGAAALLFIRPEELTLVPAHSDAANLGTGQVDTHVYQGTHVDVYVRFADARVLRVRHPGWQATSLFALGQAVGVQANLQQAFIFPAR